MLVYFPLHKNNYIIIKVPSCSVLYKCAPISEHYEAEKTGSIYRIHFIDFSFLLHVVYAVSC